MCKYVIPQLPLDFEIESKDVLKQLNKANSNYYINSPLVDLFVNGYVDKSAISST